MKELKIQSLQYKRDELIQNWINHLDSMADERIPKEILQYKSKVYRD
jgi:hypothetical protein